MKLSYLFSAYKVKLPRSKLKVDNEFKKNLKSNFDPSISKYTLGGIASICFRFCFQQTLRIQIQECQGCQKTRNFMRNSKILIARSTIQPELSKIKNHQEIHQNSLKNGKLFLILLNFGWMVDLAMCIFEFLIKFLVF